MSHLINFDPEFEYANESYDYLLEREKDRPFFQYSSPELKYRQHLIKRIKILCFAHKLSVRVKYLSIYILDYFMDNHDISEDKLLLSLICSLSIAAKVEEKDNNIPKYRELFSEQNEYSMEEVLEMESIILKFFDWVFLIPTAATYIEYFCNKCFKATELNNSVVQVVQRYLDQTIDTKFYKFSPSLVAASAIYCTRETFKLKPIWPKDVQTITKYSFKQIKECVIELKSNYSIPTIKCVKANDSDDSGFIDLTQD